MRPKKSLGQNFLKSRSVAVRIVTAAHLRRRESVLEVGPGKGILTQALLDTGAKVIAIEKDKRMVDYLRMKFAEEIKSGRLEVRNEDILKWEAKKLKAKKLRSYKLVANLPYYITGAILKKFLQSNNQPTKMVLMLQKEVVDRIIARDGKESLLSISVKAYGVPSKVMKVGRGNFTPKPSVDSAVLLIDKISKNNFKKVNEKRFFELLKRGFANKRKMLGKKLGIKSTKRAQELSLKDWLSLFNDLNRGRR